MTTVARIGSIIVCGLGCSTSSSAQPAETTSRPSAPTSTPAGPAPIFETSLGIRDVGIWSDLDPKLQLTLPPNPTAITATVDHKHHLLVLAIDGVARKVYPLDGTASLTVGRYTVALRPGDRAELAPLLAENRITEAVASATADRDGDGIPNRLDILIGAKKTVLNADAYTEGYIAISYPNGDVPREVGVCTDVIIRAVRNAGVDLQRELHDDIARARAAYPMVRGSGDPSIDQRRVRTLLPYFLRRWKSHTAKLDDPRDPLRPGDIILMDTFPSRSGPDHIGIISDTIGPSGKPLVINNWTTGTVTTEMDLLDSVPVLYRFSMAE